MGSEPLVKTCTRGRNSAASDCGINEEPSTDLSCKLLNQREVVQRSSDLAILSTGHHFQSGISVCVKMPIFSHLSGATFLWATLGFWAPAPEWRHLNKVPHFRSIG